jgi:hypothetical protein
MAGGVAVTHTDSEPLFTGTHDGADSSPYLQSMGAMFKSLGVVSGLCIENETKGTSATVYECSDDRISDGSLKFPYILPMKFSSLTWDNGDTYNIYKTGTKGSTISYEWTDVSAGFQAHPNELVKGWRPEDKDLDDHGQKDIFGPGQPEG